MIKYLNESELNEAYLSVISYGSAVLKHYENWQVEQIRNHAEIELIKLKGTKSENQKHLINESQHVIETIDSFKRSNLFEAELVCSFILLNLLQIVDSFLHVITNFQIFSIFVRFSLYLLLMLSYHIH